MANPPRPSGWLAELFLSGELARVAKESTSQNDMCRRLGVTKDAYISARIRLLCSGVHVPKFEEMRHSLFANSESATIAQDSTQPNEGICHRCQRRPSKSQGCLEQRCPEYRAVSRWPNLAAFDSSEFRNAEAVRAAQEPYTPPVTQSIKRLTRDECPDGTMILWASDVHIPIHHEQACRLMVEASERVGVTRVVAGGDILDFNCLSKHAKESRRTVEHSTVLEEVEPGRWLLNWFATKETDFILGNHEDRLKRFIDENPAFHGSVMANFTQVVDLPRNINVLPQGGEVHLGNLTMTHGDAEFKNGTGGRYPAAKMLEMFPERSSICGHLHRMAIACRTTRDEDGIPRTRRAWTMGHMSVEEMHYGYVSKNPNWQVGFAFIRVFWEGDKPRWSVYPIEVLFDKRNRAYAEFQGHVYR